VQVSLAAAGADTVDSEDAAKDGDCQLAIEAANSRPLTLDEWNPQSDSVTDDSGKTPTSSAEPEMALQLFGSKSQILYSVCCQNGDSNSNDTCCLFVYLCHSSNEF